MKREVRFGTRTEAKQRTVPFLVFEPTLDLELHV